MRQAIHRLKVEPRLGSRSPTKAMSRFTEGLSRRLAKECVTCMERIDGAEIRTPCGHYYDEQCIDQLFDAASKDEALFPPTCCGKRIPLASVRDHLSPTTLASFEDKRREFGSQRRVYCAKASCSRFLSVQYDSTRLTMSAPRLRCPDPECGTVTCMRCKLEVKEGVHHRCDKDVEDVNALELGERSGWARCPGCETMIELNQGCYHMTCRCKMEFCYLCKKQWKTCSCPRWEDIEQTNDNGWEGIASD
ncbi:hypothetical protein BD309DRAFT_542162 [Dichomitus squalens]|uniref:RING-type domain-containing protein n=2 Tax=Dichomitus squalens TaxID=114155 RepID=A0A4Q9NYQ7_9APHY|nr:hypothetical protein BD311DRAFT_115813 [Dichomitus squalens]TBU47030.1 hypothetical protein BD309DRAFT_542162 [Dichomitus squalens]